MKKTLLEWYDGYDDMPSVANSQNTQMSYHDDEKEKEEPKEKPETEVKRIENSAELYKAAAITRALESKIMMLSGVFDIDDQKKERVKKEIKELAKMIGEIVNGI